MLKHITNKQQLRGCGRMSFISWYNWKFHQRTVLCSWLHSQTLRAAPTRQDYILIVNRHHQQENSYFAIFLTKFLSLTLFIPTGLLVYWTNQCGCGRGINLISLGQLKWLLLYHVESKVGSFDFSVEKLLSCYQKKEEWLMYRKPIKQK